jgi:translation initiation factor 2-alpha kinase 4
MADPICDDINTSLPLELYTITFDSVYYTTTQGRKKLDNVYEDIQHLSNIRHPNLLSVFAVKLVHPHGPPLPSASLTQNGHGGHGAGAMMSQVSPISGGPGFAGNAPQLMILTERMPGLTLADMLEDCEFVREDRASVSLSLSS